MTKRFSRRLLVLALTLLLFCGLLPCRAAAVETSGEFKMEGTVLKGYLGSGGHVTIPDGVTRIDDGAFKYRADITGVTIPSSVASIGSSAFANCSGLAGAVVPSSVVSIGKHAFDSCAKNLTITGGIGTVAQTYAAQNSIAFQISDQPAASNSKTASGDFFSDVPPAAWYAGSVRAVVAAGLINGRGGGRFDPDSSVTLAETIKLSAAIHARLNGRSPNFSGYPWYKPYNDYLRSVSGFDYLLYDDPGGAVSRERFADVMRLAMNTFSQAERGKNIVEDGAIPDLRSASAHEAVYALYRAGILTGNDGSGTFNPAGSVKRSEMAAIAHRFIDTAQRKSFTLKNSDAG